ncbi:MAG: YihY/virulence factor BrkB family protein [Cyclobacteriaceae bacterium]
MSTIKNTVIPIIQKVINLIFYQGALVLDSIIINKEKNISLYHVTALFIKELKKNKLGAQANSVAFNFMLAIFPAIIFLFTLIPYVPIGDVETNILAGLKTVLPASIYQGAAQTIDDLMNRPREGLLSFGFVSALYLATNGTMSLMNAFNNCYKTKETRTVIYKRLIATGLTLVLSFVLICGVVLIFSGKMVESYLSGLFMIDQDLSYLLIRIGEYALFLFIFLVSISLLYYFGPSLNNKWRFFSTGSIYCTFLAAAASMAFAYYVNNFGTYNKVYGSIGTLIGFMIWLKMISFILLLGFEINASLDSAKRGIKVKKVFALGRGFFSKK